MDLEAVRGADSDLGTMTETRTSGESIEVEPIRLREVADALAGTRVFAGTPVEAIRGVEQVERVRARSGTVLIEPGTLLTHYWLVLAGEVLVKHQEANGAGTLVGIVHAGEGFGEVPLLHGSPASAFKIITGQDSVLLRFSAQDFWSMMACCPSVRGAVLGDSAQRIQAYKVEALHREKLVSLGTLAAGLMHELNNPSAAARRSASQLRENLQRLQEISLRGSGKPKSPEQIGCMKGLLDHALGGCSLRAMSSLDQADAEEAMSEWLAGAGVENAYTIGPVLVSMGFNEREIACAKEHFDAGAFSDALNWFGALVSSVTQVCAIEESIARISELVMAVKKFAYDERTPGRALDVHDSLQSTLTILGHKLRLKQIQVEKRFAASPATIETRGYALSQVWTNLIDNAADASPAGAKIEISTWSEPGWLVVCIGDHGAGIEPDVLPHIFEPFFTTKPQGSGTGLGLEIVHRIITQKFDGTIAVESHPGDTRFIVRLPLKTPVNGER